MQEQVMRDSAHGARWFWSVAGGLVLCIYQQLMVVLVAGGAGHGHGAALAAALWFGYGAPLWFLLPPIQYAVYAYVAARRKRRLGLILALAHYAGAALLVFLQLPRGGTEDVFAVAWPSG